MVTAQPLGDFIYETIFVLFFYLSDCVFILFTKFQLVMIIVILQLYSMLLKKSTFVLPTSTLYFAKTKLTEVYYYTRGFKFWRNLCQRCVPLPSPPVLAVWSLWRHTRWHMLPSIATWSTSHSQTLII